MLQRKQLSKEQTIQKLKQYCAYQERCHSEVREKLFQLGVRRSDHDELIATLIEQNYLNEERFAIAYARGKFRMNQWGKIKIAAELKKRRISEYLVKKAVKQIDDKEYLQTLKKLVAKYNASSKNKPELIRKKRTTDHLLQKGFEWGLVSELVQKN